MWSESADPIGAQDKGMPVVYVIPTTNRGRYVYRLRSEEYQENEFLGLCRSLVRDDPNLVVRIIPDERLSRDEIGLVSARLRDNGVKTVTVLNPSGTERRLSTSSSSTL